MKLHRTTLIASLCLSAFLFQTDKFMASAATAPPGACLYALDLTADRAFQIAGAQSMYAACGVVVESSASDGFEMEGAETLYLQNHVQVSVVGGAQFNGQTELWDTISNKQVQPVQVSSPGDPLASIAPPASGTIVSKTSAYFDMNSKPANNALAPGVYCGGLTIGDTNGTAFILSPGTYIMAGGGLVLNSQAIVKGTGVTVYNTSSAGWGCSSSYSYKPVTISGQVTANLSAPTTGVFDGVLFFGNRSGCSTKGSCVDQINGGSTAVLNGALYFPSDEIEITGSNASGFLMLVADKIYINGNSTFGNNGDPFDGITVSVSPATATLYSGQTQQFTATVSNTANSAVIWMISPAGVGSISSTGLYATPSSITSAQTVTVTATSQADTSKSGTATITLTAAKTTPTIKWTTPAAITYGTALSAAQLDATASVPGTFVYTPAAGAVLAAGSQTLSVTFTPTNTALYNSTSASVTIAVNKAVLTVTAANASRLYAAANPSFTYSISGFVNGDTFSVLSGAPSLTTTATSTSAPGSYPIAAAAGTLSATNYSFNFVAGTLTVTAAAQTITFTPLLSPVTYGVAPIALSATSTSGLPVSFSVVSGPGAVSGSTLTIAGAGTVVVAANQAGNADYAAAAQVTQSVTVNKATLTITASNANRAYNVSNPVFAYVPTGFVNGDTFSVLSGAPSLTTTATSTSAPGSYPVAAAAGTLSATNYSFNFVAGTLTVTAAVQTITFTPLLSPVTYGVAPIALSATSTSGLPVSFSVVSGPGAVSGSTLTIAGAGTVVVAANQPGNTDYAAAAQVTQSVAVNALTPSITWTTPSPILYGTALSGTQLNASLSVAGACVYTPAAGTVLSAGTQTLSVTCTPTDTTDFATPAAVTVQLTVNQAVPIITWATPAAINSGTALSATQLDATSTTAGTFTYTPVSGIVLAEGVQTLSVTFTPTDSIDYTTATASVSLVVIPATQCASIYQRSISIDHTKIPNTDQINFPFLFNSTDPLLATTANGGHVSNSNGYDIIFTSDAAGQNLLPFELEEYNPQIGQVIAWVQIPTVSHSQDTTIYLFYGNPNITTSQQNPTSVWDANYLGVWHVANNGTQFSLADSTSNQNNATNNGATATAGQIDGGMATDGTTFATVGTLPTLENTLSGTATYSVWVNPSANTYGGIFGEGWPGWALAVEGDGVEVELSAQGVGMWVPINSGEWSYLTVTITQITQADGTQVSYGSAYVNGVLAEGYPGNPVIDVQETLAENPTVTTYLGLGPAASGNQSSTASEDEFRISNIARSSDWIAAEYANQSLASTFYNFSSEGFAFGTYLNTYSVSLFQGQTQQFTASVPESCSGAVSWSISPAGDGTIDQTGLYTAPASVAIQQTVIVTATSGSTSASVTVTLIPPIAVSVTPQMAAFTNNGGQQQQFTATVANTINTAVTWSVSPTGAGTIDQTGLYTAPEIITNQQTVTVTATSKYDPSKSASATITLTPPSLPPPICASNGYSFMRPIVINHNLVPNSDQANFPFLFNTTDPAFATTGNGGHMANIDAYDLIFSTDPAGQNLLNFEIEEYSPVAGQIIAWIQVPNLSHNSDTVLYMFYGNAAIASSQQNPAGVWDSNFMGVWHVANPNGQLSLSDSTSNNDNATNNGATATAGQIDGGMSSLNNGSATIGAPANLANLAHGNATFSAWVNPAITLSKGSGTGTILGRGGYYDHAGWSLGINSHGQLGFVVYDSTNVSQWWNPYPVTTNPVSSGWNYVAATITPDPSTPSQSLVTLYVNGAPSGSGTVTINPSVDDSSFNAYLANNNNNVFDYSTNGSFSGSEDEFKISNIVRTPDWIATEYNNQSYPSAFYQLYSENQQGIIPSATTLYASQAAQFTDVSGCGTTAVIWSMPANSPGTLATGGLYTSPSSIAAQQAISITATSQTDGSAIGSSVVNLLPPMSVISVSPAAPTLYAANETIQFTATLSNAVNNAVTWSVSPASSGSITETGFYTAPGPMSFPIFTQTVTITATSVQDPTQSASATLTLMPVVVSPDGVVMYGGFSEQFTANIPVVWSLGTGAIGTLSQTGLYTAPLTGNTSSQGSYWATFYLYATPQADPNASGGAWIGVQPPIIQPVTPAAVSLYSGQAEAFNVCLATSATNYGCQSNGQMVANWSISPAGAGTITSSGVYTAPQWSPNQQTVTVTATDVGNPAITSSGTIALLAPAVSITPQSVTLYPDQKQQFTAVVTNSSITAVTWSISPAGAGTISSSGVYSAPPYIASQQNVTVTVASQEYPSITASAVITLLPAQCPSKAYSYMRPIVIDHIKVPITDQDNFPFYFAVTDPLLASASNGGHVSSTSGNDIFFSSDPAGLQPLPFDLEQYNPANGQIVAWVKVPVLSHSQDTVIYMFYGNSSITLPQQNPVAVWDTNYTAVYQFENLQNGALSDSTINANNASPNNVQEISGQPGAAGSFDGATSYITLPANDFPSYPFANSNDIIVIGFDSSEAAFNTSFAVWFKTTSSGVILSQTDGTPPGGNPNGSVPELYIDTNGYLRANLFYYDYVYGSQSTPQIVSSTALNDGNWHYTAVTFDTDTIQNKFLDDENRPVSNTIGTETLYIDGQVIGQQKGVVPAGYNLAYSYYLGTGYAQGWANTSSNNNNWFYYKGSLDEIEISSIARSSGWVQAEYNNQSSPSTFFMLGTEAGVTPSLNPLAVTLYESQSQQFNVLQTGLCSAGDAVWSMPSGSPGTLGPTGLYTAPATINTQQTVIVTATTLGASSMPLSATITLMPPVSVTIMPGMAALPTGGTQQFTSTVANTTNTAVIWTLNPAGVGSISPTGLYTAPATLNEQQTVSVIATSVADPTQSASATVTLGIAAPPAFTISISIDPQTAMLYASETQRFTAMVTNTTNTAVTWSVSPASAGTIDANGLYTAPATISAQQTVTITATSLADSTATAIATVNLLLAQCASNGYSYVRAITVDHTKIPNTDQTNFPFLFSTTDPLLATTVNGGHVANPNGHDIIFTSDPAGQNPLNYEIEEYNPSTGQIVAWVQIPDLSHTSDTVIYLFYGNSNITTSQQNSTGTWDSTFQAVWHLPDGTTLSANDSTVNANNGTITDAAPTTGQIDGGAIFNGSTSQINCGSNVPGLQFTAAQSFTDSAWFKLPTTADSPMSTSFGWMSILSSSDSGLGHGLGIEQTTGVFEAGNDGIGPGYSDDIPFTLSINTWHYMVGVQNGGLGHSLYIDGILVASDQESNDANGGGTCTIGKAGQLSGFEGSIDEVRIASTARSADWVAAEYANQSSPSTFFTLSSENEAGITPNATALYANQIQQFTSPSLCSGVSWSLSAGSPGTLTSSGLYTAPDTITGQQTAMVTATSQTNPGQFASATVTLMPPVSVTVSPASITLNQNQTQQFTATVNNSISEAVTWTMNPAGLGSLDQNGGYIAPAPISTQQTVTITATSVFDPSKSASAMVMLAPNTCASTGYGYQHVIVIDHTKVANTDQINFPFLFNSTDPDLATVDHGGHVANPSGYDIIFSTDPDGQTKLDFEIEQYNSATGRLVAWIRIPTLSHSSDTVIYVFYGNPAITISQANPEGVWDSNYQAVYHLGALPVTGVASDSTSFDNNAAFIDLTATPGQIDGAAAVDGLTSFLEIPATAFPNYPTGVYSNIGVSTTWQNTSFDATYSMWFKTSSWGGLLDQTAWTTDPCWGGGCPAPELPSENPDGSWGSLLDINFDGYLEGRSVGPSTQVYNDNSWHYAAITFENGVDDLYADGQLVATGSQGTFGYASGYAYFVGAENVESDTSSLDSQPWKYLPGQIDEINVSNTARSGDWIQTQFNNQSSPSAFYKFYSQAAVQVAPSSISLYAAQSEQFTVPGTCDSNISWSIAAGSLGTLTSTGLYMAPSVVSKQQIVTVSAVSQSSGASFGSAQVTLLPVPQPLKLVASSPSPYQVGTTQSFTATLLDPQGNPQIGVAVNFTVAGVNETASSATTNINGAATFTYTGSNSGTDTIQATASVDGSLLTSNSLTAVWITPPPAQASALTLLAQPSPGRGALMGAFTDDNGGLIEPIALGTASRTFITPAGATRLQLGVNDNYYEDNGGAGFVVAVNGFSVTVPATAMPWNWKLGGLNNNYQYGISDGTSPVIAAANLTAGQPVTIAYQSGTISTNYPIGASVSANGDSNFITGTQNFQGAFFPTLYTTGAAYPQNQPLNVFATVVDASGAPIPNTPVMVIISGANPGQYQATTDATGTASFLYIGEYAGNDSLQAQATLVGQGTLDSNTIMINWTNYPTPPPVGSLSLDFILNVVNSQRLSSFARDASGNPLPNVNVGFYVTGVDNFQSSSSTNEIGQAGFAYYHTQSGNYSVIAVDSVDRNVIVTQPYTGYWTVPTGSPSATGGTITVGILADTTVAMPNALTLTGTATDSAGDTPTVTWVQVSGPGTVTFANPNQASTTATFSQDGTYVLQLSATDTVNSGWAQFTVTVVPPSIASEASEVQGWVGSPAYGSSVSGIVPITLAPGVTLASGTLMYAPVNNPSDVTMLNANVSGSGQIGTLDTTMMANGPYMIQMQATDTSGNFQYSLVLVTVSGNYKPGRLTTMVTDLVAPANGLPINIQRSYDSLNAGTSGDFGYGWNLGINVNLTVDPAGNVTFTLGGQRKTFYFTPKLWFPNQLIYIPWYFPDWTPEPGLHGSLSWVVDGNDATFFIIQPDGSIWEIPNGIVFSPDTYIYTDPNGTAYWISASGQLQFVQDKNGNVLYISSSGITSSTGISVPIVRDAQNRVTQITDPQGNIYSYGYDTNGNLATVQYPNSSTPTTYSYDANHHYLSGTDQRGNPLPTTQYYKSTVDSSGQCRGDCDPNGVPLNNRIKSVTDALGKTKSYAYVLSTTSTINGVSVPNTGLTTITYPTDPAEGNGQSGIATMVYDSTGDLLQTTDPLGNVTTNAYDANLNLLSTTDPLGHTTSYTYDANGNKTSTTYPATATSTNTTSYTNYNQYSERTSTTDELGNTRTYNYDANYNPQSVTDSLGTQFSFQFNTNGTLAAGAMGFDITQSPARASQFQYDSYGDRISKTDALGRTTTYTYDSLGRKISMTSPIPAGSAAAAATTTYQYDALSHLTQTSAPLGRITSSQYDANENKISDTDARGNTTQYKYDALNRLIETDYPDGTTATKSYDFRNNVVTETDRGGHVTLHQYDLAGREVSVTQAFGTAGATTNSYAYDNAGRLASETDALGHTTNYTSDVAGNLIAVSGVAGNFTFAYDNARNPVAMIDGNGNTTQFQYDARNRLAVTKYPDGTTKTKVYDSPSNLRSVTDQANNQVQYNYDAANQLSSVVQLSSPNTDANTTFYGYDANGNPVALEDANTHTTTQIFDVLNELTQKTLPDGSHTETRSYDSNGNLASVTHFNGITTTYTYDTLNRLLSRSTPGEPTVSFTYTQTGKYLTSTYSSGSTTYTDSYTYDSMDRIQSKVTPEGTLSYTYDAAGNVASISSSNANGASMSYTYDDLNRLATVTDNRLSENNVTTYTYDNASNLVTVTTPNGVQSTFAYDALNRVTGLSSQPASYNYQRGPTGNLLSATESSGRQVNWSYDGIYRLTNETIAQAPSKNNGTVSYGLDPVGNRLSTLSSPSGVASGTWSFNSVDEISNETYDANGNVIAAGGKTFSYNTQSQLVSMNGGAVQIAYDAFGERVAKSVNGVVTRYLVEDDVNPTGIPQVFDELNGAGQVTRSYAYGIQRIDEEQVLNGAWTPSFYGYDGGGNVRQLTDSNGNPTDTYEYDAYGNSFTVSGTTPNNYLYRGEQFDSDLGLYYLRARYYNPGSGRFYSRDPKDGHRKNPQSLHKYLYTNGDPVNGIDPMGREDLVECAEVSAAGGCAALPVTTGLETAVMLPEAELELSEVEVAEEELEGAEEIEKVEEEDDCFLCFAAGTLVHTELGEVPIEKIAVGTRIITRNGVTGKLEHEHVTALTKPHKDLLIEIFVEGEQLPLRSTTHHPFWTKRGDQPEQWIRSGDLHIGDRLYTIEGAWRAVIAITNTHQLETVYNFTVDKDHDYFVGKMGFLVHNAGPCGCHGNTRGMQPAQLYALYDGFNNFLKWGVSANAALRYSATFLAIMGGGSAQVVLEGARSDMLDMERLLSEIAPGPLNNEPWAGCNWEP